ncbi:MAG TPA: endolytic transglycosylase MltG, partial [Polyangiaceae bacterium]|nr:endolytic transglycosylase MltG [Polyangiaceae bacterium]
MTSRPKPQRRALWFAVAGTFGVLALIAAFVSWARGAGPGRGARSLFELAPGVATGELAERLHEAGLVRSATAVAWYLRLTGSKVVPGRHLLRDDLSPRELTQRLTRSPARLHARVTIPEGYNHQQIAARLAELEICPAADFVAAVFNPELLRELHLRGPSSEGFLFPATYELAVDSDPAAVVRTLV